MTETTDYRGERVFGDEGRSIEISNPIVGGGSHPGTAWFLQRCTMTTRE